MSTFYGKSGRDNPGWQSWENWQSTSSWNGTHSWSSKAPTTNIDTDGEWWMSSNGSNGWSGQQSWYAVAKKSKTSEASLTNGSGSASQGRLMTKEEIKEPERHPRAASAPASRPPAASAVPSAPARAASRPREGAGAAALLMDGSKAQERQMPQRPRPSPEEVQKAMETVSQTQCALLAVQKIVDENGSKISNDKEEAKLGKKLSQAFQRALRLSALCPGKELNALKCLEDFEDFGVADAVRKEERKKNNPQFHYQQQNHQDHPEVKLDVPDYLAALHACEVAQQPLERVWTLLMDLRRKGLDLDSFHTRDRKETEQLEDKLRKKNEKPESVEEELEDLEQQLRQVQEAVAYAKFLTSQDAWEALESHAERWLVTEAPHPRAIAAILRLGSLLKRLAKRSDLDAIIRRLAVLPILEALAALDVSRLALVQDLGTFTAEALRSLGIHTSEDSSEWQEEAQRAVHRQAMIRRWTCWNECQGPGSFAWLAYDLSSQFEQYRCDGEVVGGAPKSPMVSEELFPSLEQDKRPHAERRALMLLAEKLLQGFSESKCDCLEIQGVVMLYTPFPPETASIYAMLQFLQLFPWVEMHVAFDDAVDLSSPSGPVERIRCESKEPDKAETLNGSHGTKS